MCGLAAAHMLRDRYSTDRLYLVMPRLGAMDRARQAAHVRAGLREIPETGSGRYGGVCARRIQQTSQLSRNIRTRLRDLVDLSTRSVRVCSAQACHDVEIALCRPVSLGACVAVVGSNDGLLAEKVAMA